MEPRELLEALDRGAGPLEPALAYVAAQELGLDEAELGAARRRALLVLASGGDPRRELEPDDRAVAVLAAELDTPARREALRAALKRLEAQSEGLSGVSAALERMLADGDAAWRWAACALLAEELAG